MIKSRTDFNLHPLMENVKGNKILDYRLRTRTDEKYIPQQFNGRIIFQSFTSFQQNSKILGKQIRRFVENQIKTDTINAIGGESYLYDKTKSCKLYTDTKSIISDSIFNGYKNSNYMDYNKDSIELLPFDSVLNLSTLNIHLMKQINNSSSNRLIIINCNHKDFWKKIKILSNYKLFIRKKFIDYKIGYFITVNVLVRKSFVSLGGNCAVTYQLNKSKLRNQAFPFDWSQIKLNQVINAFELNFKDFEKVELQNYSDNHNSFLVTNHYGKFAHEVIKELDIELFRSQLERRIKRIREIKNPVLIRIETYNYNDNKKYKDYWIKLLDIFDKYFNGVYKVILISKTNPRLDKINWYNYLSFDSDWTNDKLNWFNIFNL